MLRYNDATINSCQRCADVVSKRGRSADTRQGRSTPRGIQGIVIAECRSAQSSRPMG